MAARWPSVKAWLAATVPTLSGLSDVTVYAGPPVTADAPTRYVTVGYVTDEQGGTYQQMPTDDGSVLQEIGEVRSQIVVQVGDSDQSVSEASCFAIADAIEASIRADRRLGAALSPDSTVESAVDVHSIANANGTATALVHSLRYSTIT